MVRRSNKLNSYIILSSRSIVSFGLSLMLNLIFFHIEISLILFGSMIFFVDLFQPHGIDVQAGEQVISTGIFYFIQNSNDMVATSTSSRHARTPCSDNHTIRISYNLHLLFVMDTHEPLDIVEQDYFCTFIYFAY